MIILDINVISESLRPAPDAKVIEWLDDQAPSTLCVTTITLAEIRYGIAALSEGACRSRLGNRFEQDFVSCSPEGSWTSTRRRLLPTKTCAQPRGVLDVRLGTLTHSLPLSWPAVSRLLVETPHPSRQPRCRW